MMGEQQATYATTIFRSPEEVYGFWRDFKNLSRIARHIRHVEDLGNGRTRWTADGPNGEVTWEAVTTEDIPEQRIAWHSVEGSDVMSNGVIDFRPAPGDRGTELYARIQYDAPGGFFGAWFAKLTGNDAEQQIAETMRRCKAILECGEIPVVEGQPSARMREESEPGDEPRKVGFR